MSHLIPTTFIEWLTVLFLLFCAYGAAVNTWLVLYEIRRWKQGVILRRYYRKNNIGNFNVSPEKWFEKLV